jgi:hypothetical protein
MERSRGKSKGETSRSVSAGPVWAADGSYSIGKTENSEKDTRQSHRRQQHYITQI